MKWISLLRMMLVAGLMAGGPGVADAQQHALDSLRHAADMASSAEARCRGLLSLSHAYQRVNVDSALHISGRVWRVRATQPALAAEAASQIGIMQLLQGNTDSARWYLEQCREMSVMAGHPKGLLQYHNGMGRMASSLQDYALAEEHYRKGIRLADSLHEEVPLYAFYTNLGVLFGRQQRFPESVELLQRARPYYERTGNDATSAVVYSNLGMTFHQIGVMDSAIGYTLKSIQLKRKLNDIQGLCISYASLATIYEGREQWEKAIESRYQSIRLGREVGNLNSVAEEYNSLGALYLEVHQPEKALAVADSALSFCGSGMETRQMDLHQTAAYACDDLKQYPAAVRHWEKARKIAARLHLPEEEQIALTGLAECYQKMGRTRRASRLEGQVEEE